MEKLQDIEPKLLERFEHSLQNTVKYLEKLFVGQKVDYEPIKTELSSILESQLKLIINEISTINESKHSTEKDIISNQLGEANKKASELSMGVEELTKEKASLEKKIEELKQSNESNMV